MSPAPMTERDLALMAEVLHRGQRPGCLVPVGGPIVRFTPRVPSDPRPALGARRFGPENPRGVVDPFKGRKAAGEEKEREALDVLRRESEERLRADRRAAFHERRKKRRLDRAAELQALTEKRKAAAVAKAKAAAVRTERRRARLDAQREVQARGAGAVKVRATGLVLRVEGPKPRKAGDRFRARLINGGPLHPFVYRPEIHEAAS